MRNIYRLILLLIFGLLFSFYSQSQEINRIDIKGVNFNIETFDKVRCDNFENMFKEAIDSVSITDPIEISKFSKIINNLGNPLRAPEARAPLDVRVKIEIRYDNGERKYICMDRFLISKSDELYSLNRYMIWFLVDHLPDIVFEMW